MGPGAVIIKGEIVGSLEILIGPFEDILIGLLDMVMIDMYLTSSVKLFMAGVFFKQDS